MDGYVAIARIDRPIVHAGAAAGARPLDDGARLAAPAPASEIVLELLPPPAAADTGRLADLRAFWQQTTFFLFSADSWR